MLVRDEIQKYAAPEDRETLLWLLDRYHWQSQWGFVAACTLDKVAPGRYRRIWAPTREGKVLHRFTDQLESEENKS